MSFMIFYVVVELTGNDASTVDANNFIMTQITLKFFNFFYCMRFWKRVSIINVSSK